MTLSSLLYWRQKTWQMPELTAFNKLPAHATLERGQAKIDLNGTWGLQIKQKPSQANEEDVTLPTPKGGGF